MKRIIPIILSMLLLCGCFHGTDTANHSHSLYAGKDSVTMADLKRSRATPPKGRVVLPIKKA